MMMGKKRKKVKELKKKGQSRGKGLEGKGEGNKITEREERVNFFRIYWHIYGFDEELIHD